jgi:hypothetical protein
VFIFEIDERLGLMVGRHHAGGDPGTVNEILRATRALGRSGVPQLPKVELLYADADAVHPSDHERTQIAEAWRDIEGGLIFAMVTSSAVARATLGVVSLLRGRQAQSARSAFATREEAVAWIETLRHGVRHDLLRLDLRREHRSREYAGLERNAS